MKRTLLAALLAVSCSSGAQYAQAVVALVDVSGTYADQKPQVVEVIRRGLLPRMAPGDSLTADFAALGSVTTKFGE